MSEQDSQSEMVTLISASQTRLLAYIFSLTANREAAEEILQATNLVIWRKADTFEKGSNFIAWAFKIARLQILEHRSKATRDQFVYSQELVDELTHTVASHRDFCGMSERQDALLACLEGLPASRRELLWLRYRDSMQLADIAKEIGKNVSATGVLMHRLRQLLLDCIQRRLTEKGA